MMIVLILFPCLYSGLKLTIMSNTVFFLLSRRL